MFNKIVAFKQFADKLNLVLEYEGILEPDFNVLKVFKRFLKGETIKISDDFKSIWIVRNQKTLRENAIVYIVKTHCGKEHKKIWVKNKGENKYDFVIYDYNKAKHFDETSRFAFVYYPISKDEYDGSRYLMSTSTQYRHRGLEEMEIESLMM